MFPTHPIPKEEKRPTRTSPSRHTFIEERRNSVDIRTRGIRERENISSNNHGQTKFCGNGNIRCSTRLHDILYYIRWESLQWFWMDLKGRKRRVGEEDKLERVNFMFLFNFRCKGTSTFICKEHNHCSHTAFHFKFKLHIRLFCKQTKNTYTAVYLWSCTKFTPSRRIREEIGNWDASLDEGSPRQCLRIVDLGFGRERRWRFRERD
jgi:hypothetical protein